MELTQEQKTLGEIYAWIHRRAEYLRKQKTASAATETVLDDSSSENSTATNDENSG